MTRSLRRFVCSLLIALHVVSGIGAARSFVLCLCVDGGIVLEAPEESCRCCTVHTCCDSETADEAPEADGCSCHRVGVISEDALASRTIPLESQSPAALDPLPHWRLAPIECLRGEPSARELDPGRHDPLAMLRTVVLRH